MFASPRGIRSRCIGIRLIVERFRFSLFLHLISLSFTLVLIMTAKTRYTRSTEHHLSTEFSSRRVWHRSHAFLDPVIKFNELKKPSANKSGSKTRISPPSSLAAPPIFLNTNHFTLARVARRVEERLFRAQDYRILMCRHLRWRKKCERKWLNF